MMLHSDEGYQKDVGDPKAMDTVLSELKQHPDRLSRCLLHLFAEVYKYSRAHCVGTIQIYIKLYTKLQFMCQPSCYNDSVLEYKLLRLQYMQCFRMRLTL